jgi:adenylate kinase
MRIALLGVPGSGKGTQGKALAAHFGVRHISSGDLLRREVRAGTELGQAVDAFIAGGDLVPDDLVFAVVASALGDLACAPGYVLDGFPRTLSQAEHACLGPPPVGIEIDVVVYLALSDDAARQRLIGRAAQGRSDDGNAVIERRLRVYHSQTEPLLDFYRGHDMLRTIDASGPVATVTAAILEAIADSA